MKFFGGPYDGQDLNGVPAVALAVAGRPRQLCYRTNGGSGWAHYRRDNNGAYRYQAACGDLHEVDSDCPDLGDGQAELIYRPAL